MKNECQICRPVSEPHECVPIYKKGSVNPNARRITINCLGDSITCGVGSGSTPDNNDYKPYHAWWAEEYDVEVYNYGESGSHVAAYHVAKGFRPNPSRPFVVRYAEMEDNNADIVMVMGGVNDCQSGYYTKEEFGSPRKREEGDMNTFCGALRTMLEGLRQKYPKALLIYLTPLKYNDRNEYPKGRWEHTAQLPRYVEAIKGICDDYHVPVLDLYTPEELYFCGDVHNQSIYGDRLHFGRAAHQKLSQYIIKKLEEIHAVQIIE